jgi:hypothetical protein
MLAAKQKTARITDHGLNMQLSASSVQIHGGQRQTLIPQHFSYIAQHGRIGQTKNRIALRIAVSNNE